MENTISTQLLGRYIVTDPKICHGQPTFRGTRIFVADVLEQVASGMAWETIIEEWHNSISKEAIAEAVQLATKALVRRLLSHPEFNTQTKRMGTVVRISSRGIQVWRLNAEREEALEWPL